MKKIFVSDDKELQLMILIEDKNSDIHNYDYWQKSQLYLKILSKNVESKPPTVPICSEDDILQIILRSVKISNLQIY